jgi:hypothetical protein
MVCANDRRVSNLDRLPEAESDGCDSLRWSRREQDGALDLGFVLRIFIEFL